MKIKNSNYILLRSLLFIVATGIIFCLLPREKSNKYAYEENRPWSYQLLTASFDVPIYLDTLRSQAIKDSIDRNFEPIFIRDKGAEKERLEVFHKRVAQSGVILTTSQRQILNNELRQVYDRGIVDNETYSQLHDGTLPGLRTLSDNVAESVNPQLVYSSRKAYSLIDSAARVANINNTLFTTSLIEALQPNLTADSTESARFLNEAYQKSLAPIGVIQQGERIINKGDIVTPQLFTILRTYERMAASRGASLGADRLYTETGCALCIMLLFGSLYVYLIFYRPTYFRNFRILLFLMLMITSFAALALVIPESLSTGVYIVPFAIVMIVVIVFLDARTAFFTYLVTILMSVITARFPVEFIIVQFMAGLTGMVSIKDLTRRSQLLMSALLVFASYCITFTAMEIMQSGTITQLTLNAIGSFAINAVMISFAYVLIFVIEKAFGFTSKVTLVELSDINNPLLRELSEECPGTFQHSMAVSNLATVAARRIGADVQLVRAGALYHDIGKLGNPAFFTENQHGVNPHDGLDPRQSAQIVINHVDEGLKRAERAKLPAKLRSFITEHHGSGKARYFYTTYCNAHPDEEVDEAPFTYPGPNPQSRETSILMMADAVEAASRSLQDHTVPSITALVNKIIDTQIAEGLLSESQLSFADIKAIKESFISRLRTIYHARISYPEEKKKAL